MRNACASEHLGMEIRIHNDDLSCKQQEPLAVLHAKEHLIRSLTLLVIFERKNELNSQTIFFSFQMLSSWRTLTAIRSLSFVTRLLSCSHACPCNIRLFSSTCWPVVSVRENFNGKYRLQRKPSSILDGSTCQPVYGMHEFVWLMKLQIFHYYASADIDDRPVGAGSVGGPLHSAPPPPVSVALLSQRAAGGALRCRWSTCTSIWAGGQVFARTQVVKEGVLVCSQVLFDYHDEEREKLDSRMIMLWWRCITGQSHLISQSIRQDRGRSSAMTMRIEDSSIISCQPSTHKSKHDWSVGEMIKTASRERTCTPSLTRGHLQKRHVDPCWIGSNSKTHGQLCRGEHFRHLIFVVRICQF